jgi:hypothetical protein
MQKTVASKVIVAAAEATLNQGAEVPESMRSTVELAKAWLLQMEQEEPCPSCKVSCGNDWCYTKDKK